MIKVEIKRNRQKEIISFKVTGHAFYLPKGEDIVCAAVSAVTQTTVLGLIYNVGLQPEVKMRDGYLSCLLPVDLEEKKRQETQLVLEVMLTGLRSIAQEYSKFLTIND